MTRKTLLAVIVSAVVAHQIQAAEPDIATIAATGDLPPGGYRQDLPDGQLRLTEPERFLVQLETAGLYPQLEQELRAQQQIQLAPEQALSSDSWQQLSFSQISAAQARIQNEQQLAKIQIQSRFPQARVTGQFSQLENALTVTLKAPDKQQLAQQIAQLPGVKAVYPEQLVRAFLSQSVPKIEVPRVWEMQRDGLPIKGKNIRVAVLDTGVDYTHESLGGCFGAGCKVAGGYDFVAKDDDPMDVHGHGTHVASIIAGQSATITGVAPEASIIAYKVLADNGFGSTFDIIAALEKAVDPDGDPQTRDGAQIINMSLGNDSRDANDPLVVAVNNAAKAGALVVVAAGNSGPNLESLGSPGIAAEALTVANTSKTDAVSFDSSRGPGVAGALFKPEMAAPGSSIYAAIPGNKYEYKSGTSMAAPHVAGAAALLLQAEPQLTAFQLKQRLVQNTDPLKESFWDHGTGRLNVLKAVRGQVALDQNALYLGLLNSADFAKQGTRRFSVQNNSAQAVELTLKTSGTPAFLTVTLSSASVKLAPGETKDVDLSYLVDASKIPENPPGNAVYQFDIELSGGNQVQRLPVILDHYFILKVNLASPMNSVGIYTPKWARVASRYNLWGQSSVNLRLTDKTIHIFAEASSPPASLLPEETKNMSIKRDNWIFRTDVDLSATPEITVSNADIKHRLRLKSPTKNGAPFWAGDFKKTFGSVALKDGDRYLTGFTFWTECRPLCAAIPPSEFYLSDVPASFSLYSQQQLLLSDSMPQHLIMASFRFNSLSPTQDLELDFTEQHQVRLRKPAEKPNHLFAMDGLGFADLSGQLDLYIWQKSVGLRADELPDNRFRFEDWSKSAASVTTQQWRLTDDGKILKFRCKSDICDIKKLSDLELIYSSDVRELSFDNNLRYLTSPLQASADGLLIKPRYQSVDLYRGNNIFNDLWQNDIPSYAQVKARHQCGPEANLLNEFRSNLWFSGDVPPHFRTDLIQPFDCKENFIFLNYPLDGRDTQGLLGEVRFDQIKAGLESPYFVDLATFNRAKRGDTISRIDNKFSVEVASKQDPVKEFKVLLRTKDGDWKLAYHGYNAGVHQFPLPLRAGEHWLDLRLQVLTQSGNQLLNTMPEALRIGASVGGDNDVDSDGILNSADTDNDNDSVPDSSDTMPYNPTETTDSDQDGLGNNADPDDDNDGTPDVNDAFPLDPAETLDTDKDGIGNNADPDDDNDGVADTADVFPLDPKESVDTDKDGIGNNADPDDDNDGVADTADAFPLDPKETLDTDKDGIGNNADPDDDNDGVADTADAFPLDPKETLDTDKDGTGNNADPDDDNDGVADSSDKYPLDATRSSDPVTPNAGSSGSGGGGAGLGVLLLGLPLLAWRRQRSQITNKAA
ncbi:S8 family serine peptidase [Rheinheimera texasensis]|uniref:S8 family serine peptidase n=1 Tax=Rheinheimera texasensis TaxID=306205 RepID=UPI0004E23438|nr:S8 family serine peptidase [Rheinheimera texasensis]